jgi:hypothetical protein
VLTIAVLLVLVVALLLPFPLCKMVELIVLTTTATQYGGLCNVAVISTQYSQ